MIYTANNTAATTILDACSTNNGGGVDFYSGQYELMRGGWFDVAAVGDNGNGDEANGPIIQSGDRSVFERGLYFMASREYFVMSMMFLDVC